MRCDQMGQISKFFPWREYFAPELYACEPKSFPPGFFTHFGRPTDKNYDSVSLTEVRPNGSNFQNFHLEIVFRSKTWRQWSRKFPSMIFYPFLARHLQKLRICFFDRRATKICVRSFWPLCDQERPQKSATNGGLKKIRSNLKEILSKLSKTCRIRKKKRKT